MSHHGSANQASGPGAGYALRMSGEIRDWLTEIRGSDQPAAVGVRLALYALMAKGPSLTAPLVASTADAWPSALQDAIERTYQERLERLQAPRRRMACATSLVSEMHDEVAELKAAQAELDDLRHRELAAGRAQEAAQAAERLAEARRQEAEVDRQLPGVIEVRDRLAEASRQIQVAVDAFRVRKEVLKALCTAAHCGLLIDQQQKETGEAITAARARLADITAQIEQELGIAGWPEGLMELCPRAPGAAGVRILFAVEPAGTALLIAVLDGPQAVRDNRGEAILLAAEVLHRVRAGEAPEATAHTYQDLPAFLAELGDDAGRP